MIKNKKAEISIVNIVVTLVLIVALIPIIVIFSAGEQQCLDDATPYLQSGVNICSSDAVADNESINASSSNSLSVTERTLLGLIGLFIILAFVFSVVQSSGLIKKK